MKINSNDLFFAALYLWLGTNITQAITDLDVLTSAIITTIAIVSMAVYHHAKDRFNVGQEAFLSQIDDLEKQNEKQNSQIAEQKLQVVAQNQKFVLQISDALAQNENLQEQNDVLQLQIKNLLLQNETQNEVNASLQAEIETAYEEKHELAKNLNLRQETIDSLSEISFTKDAIDERVLSLGWSLERFNDFVFDDYDEKKRKVTLSKIIQTSNAKIRT
jgi:DNA repair exonuclease SbcCD ATPase subunit